MISVIFLVLGYTYYQGECISKVMMDIKSRTQVLLHPCAFPIVREVNPYFNVCSFLLAVSGNHAGVLVHMSEFIDGFRCSQITGIITFQS